MNIVNPYFSYRGNMFDIREKEYEQLEPIIAQMLTPAINLGFTIKEFGINDYKFSSGELQKTLRKTLVITLQKGTKEINLGSVLPKLIDRNYIMISGRKKLPQFQLFDIPIVTRGKMIKLRTNVVSVSISETKEKNPDYVFLSVFNRKVPFSLVLFAKYGLDEVRDRFQVVTYQRKKNPENIYEKLMEDICDYYEGSQGYTKEEFVQEVGKYFSNYDTKTKGEDIIYALDIIPQVDIMSAKFFKTDNVYDEFIETIKTGYVDDLDFRNKRIRCFEYLVLSKVAKDIFNLCISCRTQANPKFNTNSKQIIQDCNVSKIVQFDFSINPIEELTRLSRLSLVGPGGFTRENVPEYLRDVYPSMYGRICSVDTPDRENCGVLQNILPNTKLDENLRFTDETEKNAIISIPVSMVPFLEHDDQTRLQMASSQMRQAVMLMNLDAPLIKSGCEHLFTDQTQFIRRAKKNGEVVYCDENYVIIMYDDKDTDIINITPRKIYVENLDMMKVNVDVGQKVKKGDIIAESNYCKDGSIQIGKNYLTVFTSYHGFNYEDSIIISERLQEDSEFTSIHFIDLSFVLPPNKVLLSLDKNQYRPLPFLDPLVEENGNGNGEDKKFKLDGIMPEKPYAISKEIPSGPMDYGQIFEEEIELTTKRQVFVHSIEIYPNAHNTSIKEFDSWVDQTFKKQQEKEKKFQGFIYDIMPRDKASLFIKDNNLDKFSHRGKYKIKGDEINGMYVQIFGTYKKRIESGDKIGNRHGNKGVVKVLPHKYMPKLPDGRHADICVNPLSVISRMNIGQIFELHLSASLVDLKKNLLKMLSDKKSQKSIKKYLIDYIKLIDRTKENWYFTQFKQQYPKEIDEKFVNELSIIQAPFESVTDKMVIEAMKYTNTPMEVKIFDPIYNEEILNTVSWGYMYFFRMVHIAESRLAARGIAAYNRRTLQPPGGRKNKGGQRIGEMETCCFIAHGSSANLHECLTTKSDCTDLKNDYIRKTIESDFVRKPEKLDVIPESVKLLNAYLLIAGVKKD